MRSVIARPPAKCKGPLKSIEVNRLFERVQIDLIDMASTQDGESKWICHMEDHISKFQVLFAMKDKEACTVARRIHHWIAILGFFVLHSEEHMKLAGMILHVTDLFVLTIQCRSH